MYEKSILYKKNCFVYTDDDKPELTIPKQIDVKVTKPQNKHGQGKTRTMISAKRFTTYCKL